MIQWILPEEGPFYKANLHCHSTVSDGKLSPEQLVEFYQSRGYSVLAITDHDVTTDRSALNREDFLVLQGYEASHHSATDRGRSVHIGMIATTPDCIMPPRTTFAVGKYGDKAFSDGVNEMIRRGRDRGFLPIYNHMRWSLDTEEDLFSYEGLYGMELFNHFSEVLGIEEYNLSPWLNALRRGKRMFGIMADDNHNIPAIPSVQLAQIDPMDLSCGGWICIKAPELTYSAVISALQQGNFYSSCGPVIESLCLEDGVLHVKCSPAGSIAVFTAKRKGFSCWSKTETFTEAHFTLRGDEEFLVVTVTDRQGKKAVSNPFFLES